MIVLTLDGDEYRITENECSAVDPLLRLVAAAWTEVWADDRAAGRVDLWDDPELLFADYLVGRHPGMTIDTTHHTPLPTDTTGGIVY